MENTHNFPVIHLFDTLTQTHIHNESTVEDVYSHDSGRIVTYINISIYE